MKRLAISTAALCAAALVLVAALGQASPSAAAEDGKSSAAARGKYLVLLGGCNDCHTPLKMGPAGPEPDMTRMLSGHPESMKMPEPPKPTGSWIWFGSATNTAYAGPWGISYAINLTPDQNTGLGIWTEEMFVKAMKTGKHFGTSRPIMPPMPWQAYRNMTDSDLKAIYAYLRTIPAIRNHVPDAVEAPMAAAAPGGPRTR
jgi:mono/diheme cytochrome c family protein